MERRNDQGVFYLGSGIILATLVAYAFFRFPGFSDGVYREELALYLPRAFLLAVVGLIAFFLVGKRIKQLGWFSYLLLGYLFLVVVSSSVARDPDHWTYVLLGHPYRGDGVLYQMGLVGFGLLAFATLADSRLRLRETVYLLIGVGAAQALLVILQGLGHDIVGPILWGDSRITSPTGTIGNTGMVAGLFVPILVLAVLLASQRKQKVLPQLFLWSSLGTLALGVAFTGNRSALLAVLTTALLAVLLERRVRLLVPALVMVGILWLGPGWLPGATVYEPADEAAVSLKGRLTIWSVALEALTRIPGEPLLGGGPDAFALTQWKGVVPVERLVDLYAMRYDWAERYGWPEQTSLTGVKAWKPEDGPVRGTLFTFQLETPDGTVFFNHSTLMDKAHNFFLDKALSYGVLAAAIWLVLFAVPIFLGLRSRDLLQRALAWALLATFIYYQAWFAVVPTEPYHLALIGLAWASLRLPVGALSSAAVPAGARDKDEAPVRVAGQGARVAHD